MLNSTSGCISVTLLCMVQVIPEGQLPLCWHWSCQASCNRCLLWGVPHVCAIDFPFTCFCLGTLFINIISFHFYTDDSQIYTTFTQSFHGRYLLQKLYPPQLTPYTDHRGHRLTISRDKLIRHTRFFLVSDVNMMLSHSFQDPSLLSFITLVFSLDAIYWLEFG